MLHIDRNNPLPLYLQLKEILKKKILNKKRPNACIPTQRELAKAFNLNQGTVRKAMDLLAAEGLIYTIKSKGTFVAESCGTQRSSDHSYPIQDRGISQRDSSSSVMQKVFYLVVPDIEDSFVSEIYEGVNAVATNNGYDVLVLSSDRQSQKESRNIGFLKENKHSGAIIFPVSGRTNVNQILELKTKGIPFVLIDRYFRDVDTNYVIVDNMEGSRKAVRHLIDLGHKRIAYIHGADSSANEDRLEGYKLALSESGIIYDPSLIKRIPLIHREPETEGYEETKAILMMENRPTAIFAENDRLAFSALRAIQENGLSIPHDMALVGFDDLEISAMLEVPLTTVRQPKYELGRIAAELLMRKMDGKDKRDKQVQQVVLKTELVIRKSCGAFLRSKTLKNSKGT